MTARRPEGRGLSPRRRGFSLIELVVVMTVILMLTGLMLPALIQVRENAHRVICSSNLRQTGLAAVLYYDDHDELPGSQFGLPGGRKREMMAVHRGAHPTSWEGIGWLWAHRYCTTPEIFYCPSHFGEHPFERYDQAYLWPGEEVIYGNYHYAGPMDWEQNPPGKNVKSAIRRLHSSDNIVIATDGLRSHRDFNHRIGLNVLRGDNSVNWQEDKGRVAGMLPGEDQGPVNDDYRYARIWEIIATR